MDFFARQQRVRRLSTRLVLLFVSAVIGIVAVIDLTVVWVFNGWHQTPAQLGSLVLITSLITLGAIVLAALSRTASLRGGGSAVARELGGELVPQDTTDPELRRLRNVVEEIAIASGVPVPEVYVLPREEGINAFAAGWSTSDAAIAVTAGALRRLNRDELQGVIAHEFSHVVNGDMRLNIRLMGLLFGILFLTVIGRTLLYFGGGRRGRGGGGNGRGGADALPLVGLAMVVAGFIGVFAGRLIKASVSRQREYLADASAVQFTRQTAGIAGALKKIGGVSTGSKMASPRTEEVGHMLFNPGQKLSSLFATHPPLADRIKALDPRFDPTELTQLSRQWAAHPPSGLAEDRAMGLTEPGAGAAAAPGAVRPETPPGGPPRGAPPPGALPHGALPHGALPHGDARTPAPAQAIMAQIAAPSGASFGHAESIMHQIPAELLDRARRTDKVIPLVLGLLMAHEITARTAQHAALAARVGQPLADAAWRQANELGELHPLLRLPLAELCFPALRALGQRDQQMVLDAVFALINADGRITVFEYCLSRSLYGELADATRTRHHRAGHHSLTGSAAEVTTLLAVLAQAGNPNREQDARAAFAAGVARALPRGQVGYAPPPHGVLALEPIWAKLDGLRPQDKSVLIQAVIDTISQDATMTVTELELLRTVCALLHCPLPPLPGLALDSHGDG